jgi:hypothetical protein
VITSRGGVGEAAAVSSENSEGEHEPKRGFLAYSLDCAGTGSCRDLEAHPIGTKGMEGALNPYGRRHESEKTLKGDATPREADSGR